MRNSLRLKKTLALGVALALLSADVARAQALPDLGESSEAVLSESQERKLGRDIMREVRSDPAYLDDADAADYLNEIGNRLASYVPATKREFEFFWVQDPAINAFAMPGGYIGVHSGLVLTAQNESELAGVLAHEIAHVSQRHIARFLQGQQGMQLASLAALAAAILAARSGNTQAMEASIATTQAAALQSQINYTRENEREADRIGLQILERAGFSGQSMATFFDRLLRATRANESSRFNTPSYGYLRTHPLTTERIADIQNRLPAAQNGKSSDTTDFQMVRAKLRALQGSAQEAVGVFDAELAAAGVVRPKYLVYGRAFALKRAAQYAAAEKELDALKQANFSHPMAELLRAEIKSAQAKHTEALGIYRAALGNYPGRRSLIYGYAEALLAARQPTEALKLATDRLAITKTDANLYELQAKAYDALGKRHARQRAAAEASYLRGRLQVAVDQLTEAAKEKDADFFERSQAEARLAEFKAELEAMKKEKRAGR